MGLHVEAVGAATLRARSRIFTALRAGDTVQARHFL
jgi:hypothetical protein